MQQLQPIVETLVGLAVLIGMLIGVGKAWAGISAAKGMLSALHRRQDTQDKVLEGLKLDLLEVKTFLRVHPTLRFKLRTEPQEPTE